jgi:3-oxoacyl-(acyl-carrier-protein) synthase III
VRSSGTDIYVVAAGHAHPEGELTSDALADRVPGLERGWAQQRLGIDARRIAEPQDHIADFGATALRQALDRAAWRGHDLDVLICGTSFVDDLLPSTASLIAQSVAPSAIAFDVNAACASGPFAISVAEALLRTRSGLDRAAVCVAERPTAWADYGDRDSCVFWGDAAACVLLQHGNDLSGFRILGTALESDSEHADRVRVPRGGSFHHDGRYSRKQVLAMTESTCARVLDDAGVGPDDVRVFVGHQSNILLLQELSERLGIPWRRQWHNVEWAGNQGGAGVLSAFSSGLTGHDNGLQPGDLVLLAAVGGGYAAGATLLEWRP